jgi:hypothetical protein
MHKSSPLLYQPGWCHNVVMQTDLQALFVVHFFFLAAVFTPSRLTFMAKLTDATAIHTKVCRGSTSSTMTGELLKEHHVSYNQHFYEYLILLPINNAILLLFNCHKRINKFLKERHHVRFGTIAPYRGSVQIARLVHVSFVACQLLGYKATITLLCSAHRYSLARKRNPSQITGDRNYIGIVCCGSRVPCIDVHCFDVPVDALM